MRDVPKLPFVVPLFGWTLRCSPATFLVVALSTSPAHAVPITPGQGVQFSQIDWTFPGAELADSPTGLFAADFDQLAAHTGLTTGYLNVFTVRGWVVRNMPVLDDWSYGGLSTHFPLGDPGIGNITTLLAAVDLAPEPLLAFEGGPQLPWPVDTGYFNAQGIGGSRTVPPVMAGDPSDLLFDPSGILLAFLQNGHPSVEQDKNQCAPAAVANSLQWLENQYGVNVPHAHIPGIEGAPPSSLVGQLDRGMSRMKGKPVANGDAVITGKLRYIGDNNLGDDLVVKHYGLDGDRTVAGVTSDDQTRGGLSLVEWIQREVRNGEDVELAIFYPEGGGHMVDVTAAGTTLGVPWIAWVHDAKQGQPGGTTASDGGIVWTQIKDGKTVGYADARLGFALSESPRGTCLPDSTTLCLNNSRFRVTARWTTPTGATGSGNAIRLTNDSGSFWFFNADNTELVLKVLDACSFSNRFWVFACGLTNVEVELRVEDTRSGAVQTYRNPQQRAFVPLQDTNAFATCP